MIFGQKWPFFDQNGPKRPKRDFSGEIRKRHFRRIGKPQLCAKNQNNPMNGFLDLFRTDERTDGGDLIGPNRSAGDQKLGRFIVAFGSYRQKNTQKLLFWPKMAKFWH